MAEPDDKTSQESEEKEGISLADIVRVLVLGWSMVILTANYLGVFKQSLDPTYPASILSGTAASFGLAVGSNRKKKEDTTIKEQQSASKPK